MNITAAVLASVLLAQTQPARLTVDVSIVSLDVNVADSSGRHAAGLTADDFELLYDGKPQPLSHFAEYSTSTQPQPRSVALFIDDIHQATRGADRTRLINDLRQFFRANVRPGDGFAIVEWRGKMHVTQPYTDDVAALERALDEVASRKPTSEHDDWTALAVTERTKMWTRIYSGDGAMQRGTSIASESMSLIERDLSRMRAKASAMRAVLGTLAGREGRKALLFVAHRFSPGTEFMFSPVEGTMGYGRSAGEVRMSVVRAANAANVTIYGFLSERPVRDETSSAADDFAARHAGRRMSSRAAFNASKSAISHLATATGGTIATSVSDAARVLPQIAEDLGAYYSIAFRAPAEATAKPLEVRTRRRDLTVRSRREVVVESDEEKLQRTLLATLFDPPHTRGDLPWRFESTAPREEKGRRVYPFRLQIPVRALTALPSGTTRNGAFIVYVTAGGDVSRSRKTFEIPEADLARVRNGFFTYDLEIETRREETKIAIAVVDDVAHRHGIVRLDLPLQKP